MKHQEAQDFIDKLEDMITFLIPNYISEGKNQLVISIGCTGGKHRSVTLANELYKRLGSQSGFGLKIEHRDITKDSLRGKQMSFSSSVKDELCRQYSKSRHCQLAELAGILELIGNMNDDFCLEIETDNPALV